MCVVCGNNPVEPIKRVEVVGNEVDIFFENHPFDEAIRFTRVEADTLLRAHGIGAPKRIRIPRSEYVAWRKDTVAALRSWVIAVRSVQATLKSAAP
jgi:hypothetical protein